MDQEWILRIESRSSFKPAVLSLRRLPELRAEQIKWQPFGRFRKRPIKVLVLLENLLEFALAMSRCD
jgi:hypothetical protein